MMMMMHQQRCTKWQGSMCPDRLQVASIKNLLNFDHTKNEKSKFENHSEPFLPKIVYRANAMCRQWASAKLRQDPNWKWLGNELQFI